MIRQPIALLCGHVDHGKSSILEKIREISITRQEAEGITQTLKSYHLPYSQIKKIAGNLIDLLQIKITIPGILFLDSPGHAAFYNLRKRGGNLADIAIVVIDIKEGVMPQTTESIDILRSYKTPFLIALNKIDTLPGWRQHLNVPLLEDIGSQSEQTMKEIEKRLYTLVSKLSEFGFTGERFDRVDDFTRQVSIVPCSAKTGEGIPELLMVMTGLAQKYLEQSLNIEIKGPAKGTILEIKEERGVGKILDVIIYEGTIKQGDLIGIGTLQKPLFTKVKGIFEHEKGKLSSKKEVSAARGILITAPHIEGVLAGMPFHIVKDNREEVEKSLQKEIKEVLIETGKEGIIVKADTLGALEALTKLLKEKGIPIKKADITEISKTNLAEAKSEKEPLQRVILGFNIKPVYSNEVKIITSNVIYKIIEEYEEWIKKSKAEQQHKQLMHLVYPAKIQILRGTIFRQSHPAIFGIRVLEGKLKNDTPLMRKDGVSIGSIKSMQVEGKNLVEIEKNKEAAISLPKVTVGRQVDEDSLLYSDIPENDFVILKKLKKFLKSDEIELLKEIALIKRKIRPLWGI